MALLRATAAVLVLAGTAAAGAAAAPPLPPISGVSQYVEQIPSATGSTALGRGGGSTARLSPTATKALKTGGGSDAPTLRAIATDPRYGAPTEGAAKAPAAIRTTPKPTPATKPTQTTTHTTTVAAGPATPPPAEASPGAVSAAASTFGAGRLWPLALVLLAVTAGAAAVGRRRRSE